MNPSDKSQKQQIEIIRSIIADKLPLTFKEKAGNSSFWGLYDVMGFEKMDVVRTELKKNGYKDYTLNVSLWDKDNDTS